VVDELHAARGPGIVLPDDCSYGVAAGITHNDRNAYPNAHGNADTSAHRYRCAAPSDGGGDLHIDA
jgi:hypothetical protein